MYRIVTGVTSDVGVPATFLVEYVHTYPIIDFCIMLIPKASFQAEAIEFGSVRGLDKLINICSGFYEHQKNAILAEYSMHFLAMLRQSHFIKRTVICLML